MRSKTSILYFIDTLLLYLSGHKVTAILTVSLLLRMEKSVRKITGASFQCECFSLEEKDPLMHCQGHSVGIVVSMHKILTSVYFSLDI